ncbi:MAG: hypothetical protein JW924_11215 [Fusobacteriaceae bacterium]|nr:hypothetical protein [Fusobacteriaceae bacterium]
MIISGFFIFHVPAQSATTSSLKEVSYNSVTLNSLRKLYVYLPSGYEAGNNYPVLYLLHGIGGDHTQWVTGGGNAKSILDNAISSGKSVPMIVVIPDCGGTAETVEVFTKELLNDIIPYVEKNYHVKTDKDNRALAGLSWGGLQTLDAGLYNYTKFGYLGVFSSGWFTSDTAKYNTMKSYLQKNGASIENNINYFYFGDGTSSDIAYENGLATIKVLRDSGITIHYFQHPGGHSFTCWNADLTDFVPFIFQKASSLKLGDVNNDGKIDITDALMVAQYSVGNVPPGFITDNADVNKDGIINIVDALRISQYYVGLISDL